MRTKQIFKFLLNLKKYSSKIKKISVVNKTKEDIVW